MSDLSLIPIEDLCKEIKNRTSNCIIAHTICNGPGNEVIRVEVKADKNWLTCAGLLVEIQDYINAFKPRTTYEQIDDDGDDTIEGVV